MNGIKTDFQKFFRIGVERIVLKVFSKNNGDRHQDIRSFKAAGHLFRVLRRLAKYIQIHKIFR
jgi:hypothetical protein